MSSLATKIVLECAIDKINEELDHVDMAFCGLEEIIRLDGYEQGLKKAIDICEELK